MLAGLDARFGWSAVPLAAQVGGFALVAVGFGLVDWTLLSNPFASSAVRIQGERDQAVISTGPYALVRHPMYSTALVMMAGIPIALGSLWGLLAFAAMMPALIWRIFDEEKFLVAQLPGYAEYKQKVRYRHIPHLW